MKCGRCVMTSAEACCSPQPTGRKITAASIPSSTAWRRWFENPKPSAQLV